MAKLTTTMTIEQTLSTQVEAFLDLQTQITALEAAAADLKAAIEIACIDAGRSDDLADGFTVDTPAGPAPVKLVTGTTTKFDREAFLKKHKLTPADWAKFETTAPKAPYLRIGKPKGTR
jgi:hypothetical protein